MITALQLTEMINKVEAALRAQNLTKEKLEHLHTSLNMGIEEYVKFQEIKSVQVGQSIDLDAGMMIYRYLGGTPETFNGQSIAVKYVLTQLLVSMLSKHIESAQAG